MSAGFFLMHRGAIDHPAFGSRKREPLCRFAAWVWLIEHAAFAVTQVRIAGKSVELRRGQLSYSWTYLADAWGWHRERCRRFLRELENRHMLATETDTGQMVITICNYELYQNGGDARDMAPTQPQTEQRHSSDRNNKEGNQVKKESKNLKREGLGRDAPSGGVAPADPEPPAEIATGTTDTEPPLTPEERAEMAARLDAVIANLKGHAPAGTGIRDPVAYAKAVRCGKRDNWINAVHAFASERFEGQSRWDAWEACDIARRAGSREATPRDVSALLDRINDMRLAEQKVAA
jgi:hypothetical protein